MVVVDDDGNGQKPHQVGVGADNGDDEDDDGEGEGEEEDGRKNEEAAEGKGDDAALVLSSVPPSSPSSPRVLPPSWPYAIPVWSASSLSSPPDEGPSFRGGFVSGLVSAAF